MQDQPAPSSAAGAQQRSRLRTACLVVSAVSALSLSILSQTASAGGTVTPAPAPVDPAPQPEGLKGIPVPTPSNINQFVRNSAAAVRLGKALFWDMQLGSDGQTACASCHFHAGVDSRSKNQVTTGMLRMSSPGTPNPDFSFQLGGPNYQLKAGDFPFHKFLNPADRNSTVQRTHNDSTSSQGAFKSTFVSSPPGAVADSFTLAGDPVFNLGGIQTRQVEPRNTPSMINAIFNFRNFWDGRATFLFNGATPFGAMDANARVYKTSGPLNTVGPVTVRIDNASLASLATGPALSELEMTAAGRTWPHIGVRLLPARPLVQQAVSSTDSVLAGVRHSSGVGLNGTYLSMVQAAFRPEWWQGTGQVSIGGAQYTQAQANFSMFFGLAIQMYGATLVSDDSPFDRFMAGTSTALSADASAGMGLFFGKGNCAECHGGAEFTNASVRHVLAEPMSRMPMGNGAPAVYDEGFYNISVARTLDDIANGGRNPVGRPLSLTALAQQVGAAEFQRLIGIPANVVPAAGERIAVNGAFKTPTIRNAELTAPYFHNGSVLTLEQVVQFYNRGGNHFNNNLADVDAEIQPLGLTDTEQRQLVAFIKSTTDDRVRYKRAPFDHPQLTVINGHLQNADGSPVVANGRVQQVLMNLPAVGRAGVSTPEPSFLEIYGNGLRASYFSNRTLSGTPVLQRLEAINLNPGLGSPASGVPSDNFSVRWQGVMVTPDAGSYVLRTLSDDGARVWVNGRLVIDHWTSHAASYREAAALQFKAGERINLMVEYYDTVLTSRMALEWRRPGSTAFETVPKQRLYAPDLPTVNSVACGNENQTCNLPAGTFASVWFGTGNNWVRQDGLTGSVSCNNATFGDPMVGTAKSCRYALDPDTPAANAVQCANEGASCTVPAGRTATVWYGSSGSWTQTSGLTGSVACSNNAFGDPINGAVKTCRILTN